MFLDDRETDRQTESTARRFCGEIRIENFCRNVVGNAGPLVCDRYFDVSPVRHCLTGIDHQGIYDLLDLNGIDFRAPEFERDFNFCPQTIAVEREICRLGKQFGHHRDFLHRCATLRECQ